MSFKQFLLVLRARWLIVACVTAIVLVTAVTLSLVLPKRYTANASVLVDFKATDPVLGMMVPAQFLPGYMATQIDIVTSDRVALRVVKSLKLDELPRFHEQWLDETEGRGSYEAWLAALIEKKLDVKPARESNVINIAYTWTDAAASALLANAFAQAYMDTAIELKVEPAKQYSNWFQGRTLAMRDNLEKAQRALSDYQRTHGIVTTDERLDVENERLAELGTQLVAAQSQRSEAASRQRTANASAGTLPEVLQNPTIAALRADLARMDAKREDVASRLGQNHPELQRTDAEIRALRERLNEETSKVVSSVGNNYQANGQREAEMRAAVEAQKQRVLELKRQRDQTAVLEKEVENAQHNYDLVAQRYTQTNLESLSQQTNVVVLTPASEPADPSFPKLWLNIVLSIILGGLLGAGTVTLLEFIDQRVRGSSDLAELLNVPVVGSIPFIVKKAPRRGPRREPIAPANPIGA